MQQPSISFVRRTKLRRHWARHLEEIGVVSELRVWLNRHHRKLSKIDLDVEVTDYLMLGFVYRLVTRSIKYIFACFQFDVLRFRIV